MRWSLILTLTCVLLFGVSLASAEWDYGLTNGLISYYPFEGSGLNVITPDVNITGPNCNLGKQAGKIGNSSGCAAGSSNILSYTTFPTGDKYNFSKTNLSISFWTREDGNCAGMCNTLKGIHLSSTGIYYGYTDDISTQYFIFPNSGATYFSRGSSDRAVGMWYMITIVWNGTTVISYENDTKVSSVVPGSSALDMGGAASVQALWNQGGTAESIDEIGVWNRALTPGEVATLYNSGNGLTYGDFVVLTSPRDGEHSSNSIINFTANYTTQNYNFTNATYYIWNSTYGLFNQTTKIITGNTINGTTITPQALSFGTYYWNVLACEVNATTTYCGFAPKNYTLYVGASVNSDTYNTTTYQTASESFITNISVLSGLTPSIATLYLGTDNTYTGTITNTATNEYIISKNIDIPIISGSNNWFWEIVYSNGFRQNLSSNTQTISVIDFGFCNATLTVPYINFTSKDEGNLSSIAFAIPSSTFEFWLGSRTVSKTYTFLNNSVNPSYTFCFSPAFKGVNIDASLSYSATSYPTRSIAFDSLALTNSTTNQILYLLYTSQGISSSIQTVQSIGNPVSGVLITAERQISGSWITVGSALSDSSGLVTFFVNPNYDMRVTASKLGYATQQVTIRPSQTQYSIVMNPSSGTNVTYTSDVDGITWRIFPATGQVGLGAIDIGINITSTKSNLLGCKLDILQQTTNTILTTASASGTTSACDLSTSYTVPAGTRVYVQYYVKTTGSGDFFLIDGDQMLYNFGFNNTNTPTFISNLFKDLNNLPEFGNEPLRQEFSKIIAFFFIAILLIGLLCYFTEYDRMYPGFFFILLTILIMVATKAQFLTVSSPGLTPWLQQYAVAIIAILFNLGYVFNTWGKVA